MINMTSIKKHYNDKLYDIAHRNYEKGEIVLLGDCVIENLNIEEEYKEEIDYDDFTIPGFYELGNCVFILVLTGSFQNSARDQHGLFNVIG